MNSLLPSTNSTPHAGFGRAAKNPHTFSVSLILKQTHAVTPPDHRTRFLSLCFFGRNNFSPNRKGNFNRLGFLFRFRGFVHRHKTVILVSSSAFRAFLRARRIGASFFGALRARFFARVMVRGINYASPPRSCVSKMGSRLAWSFMLSLTTAASVPLKSVYSSNTRSTLTVVLRFSAS